MQGRWDEQEERRKSNTIDPEGAESLSHIVNDCTLLSHDTEPSKMAGELDLT